MDPTTIAATQYHNYPLQRFGGMTYRADVVDADDRERLIALLDADRNVREFRGNGDDPFGVNIVFWKQPNSETVARGS